MNIEQIIENKQQQTAEWSERKQEEREMVKGFLESSVSDICSISDNYKAFLDFLAVNGSRYNANNAAIALAQMPEATRVGSLKHWNDKGRTVIKGETGIRVRKPDRYNYIKPEQQVNPENGEVNTKNVRKSGVGYSITSVFDVSQTTGKELKQPHSLVKPADYEKAMKGLIEYSRAPLEVDNGLNVPASYDSKTMSISINPNFPDGEILYAVAKEAAHSDLHCGGNNTYYVKHDNEFFAKSIAHVVCRRFGVEPPNHSYNEVAQEISGFALEDKKDILEMIHDISKSMGGNILKEIDPQAYNRSSRPANNGKSR